MKSVFSAWILRGLVIALCLPILTRLHVYSLTLETSQSKPTVAGPSTLASLKALPLPVISPVETVRNFWIRRAGSTPGMRRITCVDSEWREAAQSVAICEDSDSRYIPKSAKDR